MNEDVKLFHQCPPNLATYSYEQDKLQTLHASELFGKSVNNTMKGLEYFTPINTNGEYNIAQASES